MLFTLVHGTALASGDSTEVQPAPAPPASTAETPASTPSGPSMAEMVRPPLSSQDIKPAPAETEDHGVLVETGNPDEVVKVAALDSQPFSSTLLVNQQDGGIEIRSITIEGLQRLDQSVVLTALTIKAGDVIVGNVTAKLNETADALYNSGWFRGRPELELDSSESGGAILRVVVQENPGYAGVRITGNTIYTTERLVQEIEGAPGSDNSAMMKRGEVINAKKLVAALDRVLAVYHAGGYIGASYQDWSYRLVPPDEGVVEIILTEGIIEEIIVTGNDKTKQSVIDSQITHMSPGQVLTRYDLEQDVNDIYNTGLFEAVNPELEPSLVEGQVKVVISVEEAPTGQAGIGLGYSTVNGLQGTLSYSEKNLFGSGKQLAAQLIFSGREPGYQVSFSDPYFTENSFWSIGAFNLHDRQQRFPSSPYESELEIDTRGFTGGYGRRLSDTDTWQANFSVTDYDYDIRKGDPFRGLTPRQRARLSASGETRKLGTNYTHDTRDNVFETTEGVYASGTAEFAGFGGDFNFNKYTLEGREFMGFGPGVLGFRQRLGFSTGDLPIYEEYRLGGVNSIRGVSEDLLTGSHSMLSNVEYRYRISDMFGVVGFLDYGAAGESFSDMDNAAGAGIGARIKLRALGIGSVRLDYGWELAGETGTNNRFHFFLGEMF
ncbi:BamA/TamA family outer membrane protein [bacterium]|nr:BamA/TamA family outer membrane protein [bacterium]